jgi:hypothetical protein
MTRSEPAGVIRRHAMRLMALPGVIGLAEGRRNGAPCLVVLVSRRGPEVGPIPSAIEGIPVRVLETGVPEAR